MSSIKKQIICSFIVGLVLLISAGVLAFRYFAAKGQEQIYAYIYQDSVLIQVIDLTAVEEAYSFTLGDKDGDYNTIEVRQGSIGMTGASCPDHVCVNTGFIETDLVPIVCLPNKVVIEIHTENNADEARIDAVTQ